MHFWICSHSIIFWEKIWITVWKKCYFSTSLIAKKKQDHLILLFIKCLNFVYVQNFPSKIRRMYIFVVQYFLWRSAPCTWYLLRLWFFLYGWGEKLKFFMGSVSLMRVKNCQQIFLIFLYYGIVWTFFTQFVPTTLTIKEASVQSILYYNILST